MNKKQLITTWAIGILLLSGCATMLNPIPGPPIEYSKVYNSSYNNVWGKTLEYLNNSGELITAFDKDFGLISFQKSLSIKEWRKYAYTNPILGYNYVKANVNIRISKINEEQTKFLVNCKIFCEDRTSATLASKGILENKYLYDIGILLQ